MQPIWFDSMGAKSSCTFVSTPDISVVIDPGIAVMQPSFPASDVDKETWMKKGKNAILKTVNKADILIISHYHYDHFIPDEITNYKGKIVFLKNPNEYINDSQRTRAGKFFENIFTDLNIEKPINSAKKQTSTVYRDPLNELPLAQNRDFKAYTERRNELLEKGKKWFDKRAHKWNSYQKIPEVNHKDIKIRFPEEKSFTFNSTILRFSKALFHGIEFSRVGWIYITIIEHNGKKLIHTSDINGPIIEDYAEMIINENPDILILDGPMTYMYGYLLNKTNLERAIENAVRIVREIDAEVIIYDHHLPREKRYKERTKKVWKTAKKYHRNLMTAAEYLGDRPVVERLGN
jgi:hypothetical protein